MRETWLWWTQEQDNIDDPFGVTAESAEEAVRAIAEEGSDKEGSDVVYVLVATAWENPPCEDIDDPLWKSWKERMMSKATSWEIAIEWTRQKHITVREYARALDKEPPAPPDEPGTPDPIDADLAHASREGTGRRAGGCHEH